MEPQIAPARNRRAGVPATGGGMIRGEPEGRSDEDGG